MPSIQGEFRDPAAALKAVEILVGSGVAEERIQQWNILPEGPPKAPEASSVASGAVVGGLLGGPGGLATGAALGAAWDSASEARSPLPAPSGVRVVVRTDGAGPDVASLLRSAGAVNVGPAPG